MLIITRNPLGFKNKKTNSGKDGYQGVTTVVDERGIVSDAVFLKDIESILNTNNININKTGVTFQVNTALPDRPAVAQPSLEQSEMIVKTYVVEKELTDAQHRQARLKNLSTL